MIVEQINVDFSKRVVVRSDDLPWTASPQAGVDRRPLDRVGGEIARATTIVRYAPKSAFAAHEHSLGEEFLVLEGVFSDEHGDFPRGTYVRNPPGGRHTPRTESGCVIFVKLRQMQLTEADCIVKDTTALPWVDDVGAARRYKLLHEGRNGETVRLEQLIAGRSLDPVASVSGEEILVLEGELHSRSETFPVGTWIRNPAGYHQEFASREGAVYWVKRGHLAPDIG